MTPRQNPPLAEAIAGALEWWRDAGVDCAFLDEPVAWLTPKNPASNDLPIEVKSTRTPAEARVPEPVSPQAPRLDPASIPATLDSFAAWWLNEPQLAEGALNTRVAPRGSAGAELMIVVPEPEREDSERLLSGPQGRLLDAMLSTFGLSHDQVYFASVIPRHLPGADWGHVASSGLGLVLERHIALAAPKRLAVFGSNILPLLSHAPPQGPADLRKINHEGGNMSMLACRSLAALLEQPRWKARVWHRWLEMTE